MTDMTATELMTSLLAKTTEAQWELHVWPIVLVWNKSHYKIPEDLLRKVFDTFATAQANENSEPSFKLTLNTYV
jgi:hypothetical protein